MFFQAGKFPILQLSFEVRIFDRPCITIQKKIRLITGQCLLIYRLAAFAAFLTGHNFDFWRQTSLPADSFTSVLLDSPTEVAAVRYLLAFDSRQAPAFPRFTSNRRFLDASSATQRLNRIGWQTGRMLF